MRIRARSFGKFDSARRWDLPSRVYSDATPIVPGMVYPRALLEPKLNHVGYHEVKTRVANPGEYRYSGSNLEVYLNERMVYSGGRMSDPVTAGCRYPHLVTLPAPLLQPADTQTPAARR